MKCGKHWQDLLRPEEVILDIGANIGFTVQRFFSLLKGQCEIYAFEPNPRIRRLLEVNTRALNSRRIHLVESAVGNRNGRVGFCDNCNHGALSKLTLLRAKDPFGPHYWIRVDEYEVDMVTLDSLVHPSNMLSPSNVTPDGITMLVSSVQP